MIKQKPETINPDLLRRMWFDFGRLENSHPIKRRGGYLCQPIDQMVIVRYLGVDGDYEYTDASRYDIRLPLFTSPDTAKDWHDIYREDIASLYH